MIMIIIRYFTVPSSRVIDLERRCMDSMKLLSWYLSKLQKNLREESRYHGTESHPALPEFDPKILTLQ
jgi:hypothetical protein